LELLQAVPTTDDLIKQVLTFRLSEFSACANSALQIVDNEETALWYEGWLDTAAEFILKETLRKGQLPDPEAEPGTPPLFTPEILPEIESYLNKNPTLADTCAGLGASQHPQDCCNTRSGEIV
jgi:hypothetical protein